MKFHLKLKYLFSTHKRLSFAWIIILSVLWLACDPDEDISKPSSPNPIGKSCNLDTEQVADTNPQSTNKQPITFSNEPKFNEQWYLNGTNSNGIDIKVLPVWRKGLGDKAVSVGVIDTGVDTTHPDLRNHILLTGFGGYDKNQTHGTNVAGLIAARDNNMGMIGVAPKANICSFSVITNDDDQVMNYIVNSFQHKKHRDIAVYNASLGFSFSAVGIRYQLIPTEVKKAIDDVTKSGFDNKGSSIVFAAGNAYGMATNDGYLHHYPIISVNAIKKDGLIPGASNRFGHTNGVNLWITAPTGSYTTTNGGGYKEDFGQTSSAAPLVSGAIALLRSEFPTLTWRDVKLILAESATKYDESNKAKYKQTGVFYSNSSTAQTYSWFMGFGLLNVEQAFSLAKNWKLLPPMKEQSRSTTNIPLSNPRESTTTFSLNNAIGFIESLTLELEFKKDINYGWNVVITSPDNKEWKVSFAFMPKKIMLLFNTFLGNRAVGNWKIKLTRPEDGSNGDVESVSLTLRGH